MTLTEALAEVARLTEALRLAEEKRDLWIGHCLVVSARMLGVVRAALEADGAPVVIKGRGGEAYAAMLESFIAEARALLGDNHKSVKIADRVAANGLSALHAARLAEGKQ